MPTPQIIAHRGASRERPENTLPAFARAIELGADGVELDVHVDPDGVLRVHHDPLPPELLAGGAASGHRAPLPPTLAEVLALLAEAQCVAYCELKGPATAPGTVAAILAAGGPAAVHAFDHREVERARQLAPEIPRGVLEVSYPLDGLAALRSVEGRDLWRHRDYVDEALIRTVQTAGGRVIAWTVNEPDRMTELAALGVDGICTDDPALARAVLGR